MNSQLYRWLTPDERITESIIEVTDGSCLISECGITNGYCYMNMNGKKTALHRYVYEREFGKIPKGYVIDHLCENTQCINPYHLEVVTNKENVLRGNGLTAQNARKTHCKRGHEFTPENTYLDKAGKGRACNTCMIAYSRNWRATHKTAQELGK